MRNAMLRTALTVAALVWLLAGQGAFADEVKRYVTSGSRAAGLDACVEPTSNMRRHHMDFIKHQRISTVHEGVRGGKYELVGCVECHISYDADKHPKPINEPDQFCGACHAYAAVRLNCFDCHASVPERGNVDPKVHSADHIPLPPNATGAGHAQPHALEEAR